MEIERIEIPVKVKIINEQEIKDTINEFNKQMETTRSMAFELVEKLKELDVDIEVE